MKAAATKATTPSKESDKMKADKKRAAVANNNEDRRGVKSIKKAAAAIASLLRPAKRKLTDNKAAAPTQLKKTKAKIKPAPPKAKTGITVPKKAGHHSEYVTFWKRFAELCKYKADHGKMRVPRTNASKNNTLAEWVHYIRKRYMIDKLPVQYMDALKAIDFEWTAIQIPK
jgi:hypothetical protein